MASDEIRKKWGTIYMGNREASLEQLNAMQEPLRREQEKKEQTEDYMERVRARAADRAREILGAAYAERQKVLEEAKTEAQSRIRQANAEASRLKAEGEAARKAGVQELEKAESIREEAEKIKAAAHDEGFQNGMDQAGAELSEFRAELGQSLSSLLHAIERERKHILAKWRDELAELTIAAVQAGTGFILQNEHKAILKNLVFQALNLLEDRTSINLRVNPADENVVADMFQAAKERFPELKQWIITGDEKIESGGIVAESLSGSVDLQRENFKELVDNILCHLGVPELGEDKQGTLKMRDLVEKEVAHIASLTPEAEPASSEQEIAENQEVAITSEEKSLLTEPDDNLMTDEENLPLNDQKPAYEFSEDPTLAELEEELFPLDDQQDEQNFNQDSDQNANPPVFGQENDLQDNNSQKKPAEADILTEGGFL